MEEALDYVAQCGKLGLIHHLGFIEKDSVWLEVDSVDRKKRRELLNNIPNLDHEKAYLEGSNGTILPLDDKAERVTN